MERGVAHVLQYTLRKRTGGEIPEDEIGEAELHGSLSHLQKTREESKGCWVGEGGRGENWERRKRTRRETHCPCVEHDRVLGPTCGDAG